MHIIDEVLVPLTPKPPNSEIDNIDALEFMRSADKVDLGGHNLRTYRSQVSLEKKESLFQAPGGHTFLVPVDAGFKVCCSLYNILKTIHTYLCLYLLQVSTRSNLVDGKVIDGHVIPNTVVFTAASQKDEPRTSAAFEDLLKVTVSFFKQKDGKSMYQACFFLPHIY